MNWPGTREVSALDKSFPSGAIGHDIDSLLLPLADFSTPLFAVDRDAMNHNLQLMAAWTRERGLELMPHGKTTMSPILWRRQLDAGATGITLATGWQANVALLAGVPTVQLANECVDRGLWARLISWLEDHEEQELICWVDSAAGLDLLESVATPGARLGVLVELGANGGRTGVRDDELAISLAERVGRSRLLSLRGVAGYEGALAHDRSEKALGVVREYCDRLVALLADVAPAIDGGDPWITAGGSAFFDIVAESFASAVGARKILRSGAYLVHDSGFYRGISPLDGGRGGEWQLSPAMWGFARVVSLPESGLALLDAGKRDLPFDEGLPQPVAVASDLGEAERDWNPDGASIAGLNDQHAFLRWEGRTSVKVGDVVRLALSHPCTAFDKWRLVPIFDPATGVVTEAVETFF